MLITVEPTITVTVISTELIMFATKGALENRTR